MNKSTNKFKQIKANQFLEFFSLIEEKKVNAAIVLMSDEVKSIFYLKHGCIETHKSNLKRQNSLEKLQKNGLNLDFKEKLTTQLTNLSTFEQWNFLFSNNLIDQKQYQAFIQQDCEAILQHHFLAKDCFVLKIPPNKSFSKHLLPISLYNICLTLLKRHIPMKPFNNDIGTVTGKIKNIKIFNIFLQSEFDAAKLQTIKLINDQFTVTQINEDVFKELSFLKEQNVIDFDEHVKKSIFNQTEIHQNDFQQKNAFEILNLNSKSNSAEIKKRYLEMVAQYHPDKVNVQSEDEKKQAESVFAQITTAYNQISSEEKKKQYIKNHINKALQVTQEQQVEAMNLVEAEAYFLEGQAYLKKSAFELALEKFDKCFSIKKDDKYLIYANWAKYRLGVIDGQKSIILEARESLKKHVLTDMPMLEALFYLANIEKYLGELKLAKRYLEQIIVRDPYFMTAKIELGLINKRLK